MFSIKRQLNRNLILFLVIILLLFFLSLVVTTRYILKSYAIGHLEHDIDSMIRSLTLTDTGDWQLETENFSEIYNSVYSGSYYQIQLPDKSIIYSRSAFDLKLAPPRPQEELSMSYDTETEDDQDLLVLQLEVEIEGQPIIFWVAEDMTFIYHTLLNFLTFAGFVSIVLISLLIIIQQRFLSHSFDVFNQLKDKIQRVTDEGITLNEANIPSEVEPLVTQIQSLVDQLKLRNQRTRSAIGDLSHELKRPLQLLSINAEQRQDQSLLGPLQEIKNIIDRELRRAKVAGSRDIGGQFDPETELADLLVVMRKIHSNIEFSISVKTSLNLLNLDRDDMLELFGNLIDNAGKFSQHKVHISLSVQGYTFNCVIEDDGPGVPEEQYEHVLKPGTRLDESVQGHGIGLRICRDIINGYKGKLVFARSELGGLAASVSIPVSN